MWLHLGCWSLIVLCWVGTTVTAGLAERAAVPALPYAMAMTLIVAVPLTLLDSDLARRRQAENDPFRIHATSLVFGGLSGYLMGLLSPYTFHIGVYWEGVVVVFVLVPVYAVLAWLALSGWRSYVATMTLCLSGVFLGATATFLIHVPADANEIYAILTVLLVSTACVSRFLRPRGEKGRPVSSAWPVGWAGLGIAILLGWWWLVRDGHEPLR